MEPVTLHYSEALVKRAVRAFWFRVTAWSFFLAMVVLIAAVISLIVSGDRSWWVGMGGTVVTIGVLVSAAVYLVQYRGALGRLRRLKRPEALLEIDEDGFRVTSDSGSVKLPWSGIAKIWRFPEFWLLFPTDSGFMTIPLADFDDEYRTFLITRASAHGAKIR